MKLSKVLLATGVALLLSACKQELPKTIPASNVFGTVQKLEMKDNVKQLIYTEGEDPYKKNWGAAALYVVTVKGEQYWLNFDQTDAFKALKEGDRVSLQSSNYIACVGENELKPTCMRLMRVYKSDKRIIPTFN